MKAGTKLWSRDLKEEVGPLNSRHGLGSSLAHTEELLFINLEHDGPSALMAIQKSDGATKWKSEGHTGHPGGGGDHSAESKPTSHRGGHSGHGSGKNPGGGMLAGMLRRDTDGDGMLTGDEIPGRLNSVMENIDLNKDESLDKGELKKMADSFAAKRKGSKQSSRDPIVYGVAADSGGIIVRTGTRLYAIGGTASNE